MSYIVIIDLRENNGHYLPLEDEHGNLEQFETEQEAIAAAKNHFLTDGYCAYAISVDNDEIISI